MISPIFDQLLIPYLAAMVLAITMGGSGTAPAFSAAFGANVIRKSLIPGLFGIMVFLGAILAGKGTATTMGKGLLNSHKLLFEIIPTWFILPVISFFIALFFGKYIYKPMRKRGLTMPRARNANLKPVWNGLLILMSLYVAFSIGANNVANAAGPIASMTINELNISQNDNFTLFMILSTLIVAPCFGIGSSIFGHKIVKNTGKEIVLFGKFEAVIIAFISASLLLFASLARGVPTSLVQLNVAAILGIGVAKLGAKNIFRKTEVRKFFAMWIIAPFIAFSLSLLLTYLTDRMGYL